MKKLFLTLTIFAAILISCEDENVTPTQQEQINCYTCHHKSIQEMYPAPDAIYYWDTQFCGTIDEMNAYEDLDHPDHAGVDYCNCVEN